MEGSGSGCRPTARSPPKSASEIFQPYGPLTNVRSEHHDRLAVPHDINQPVAVQRTGYNFDYRSIRDRSWTVQPIMLNDRKCGNVQTVPLAAHRHGEASLARARKRFY